MPTTSRGCSATPAIVRNRAKIEATIHNAGRVIELDRPLDELLWSFAPASHVRPATLADVPATSPESVAMAKELKRRGLRFVGPTTCYALMQAAGLVDDHVADVLASCRRCVTTWSHWVKHSERATALIAPVFLRSRAWGRMDRGSGRALSPVRRHTARTRSVRR